MADSHKKPILTAFPVREDLNGQPNFISDEFDKVLDNLGYDCMIEKHIKCPCINKGTKQALPTCRNCMGSGHIFIDRRKTRMAIQAMNRDTKFKSWTEDDKGTVQISGRFRDELCFMDRVIVLDTRTYFSQTIQVRKVKDSEDNDVLFGFFYYYPLFISEIYMFNDADNPLRPLLANVDYEIRENVLLLNVTKYLTYFDTVEASGAGLFITVRYQHYPTYNIIDILRADIKSREDDCEGEEQLRDMPINAVGRKSHFLLDDPDFDGNSVFDNTIYSDDPSYNSNPTPFNTFLFQATDPNNLDHKQVNFDTASDEWIITISDHFTSQRVTVYQIWGENGQLKGSDLRSVETDFENDTITIKLVQSQTGWVILSEYPIKEI
jgi:hypothetical protein